MSRKQDIEKRMNQELDEFERKAKIYGELAEHGKGLLQEGSNVLSNATNLTNAVGGLANAYVESKRLDVAALELKKQMLEIAGNHKQNMAIITKVFEERRYIFENLFKKVDQGIEQENDKVLFAALNTINSIAKHNPLEMMDRMNSIKIESNDDEPLQLDF